MPRGGYAVGLSFQRLTEVAMTGVVGVSQLVGECGYIIPHCQPAVRGNAVQTKGGSAPHITVIAAENYAQNPRHGVIIKNRSYESSCRLLLLARAPFITSLTTEAIAPRLNSPAPTKDSGGSNSFKHRKMPDTHENRNTAAIMMRAHASCLACSNASRVIFRSSMVFWWASSRMRSPDPGEIRL